MEAAPTPIVKDLVLVGGGHSHIAVLKKFGMQPVPGVRLTLICREVHTPYSGMLPGLIARHYAYDEAHIDLRKLAVFASARFICAEVTGLDPEIRELRFANRPPIPYDLLSLNTGSTPGMHRVPGADEFAVAVKPISRFLPRWEVLARRLVALAEMPRIAVVGAGAGGVELTLSMQHRLKNSLGEQGKPPEVAIHLFSATDRILPTHNTRVRGKFGRILAERGVSVHCGSPVAEVSADGLRTASGWTGRFHGVVWVTDACAAEWLGESDLATDERNCVRVDDCLRSVSHPSVFAAGDVAAVDAHPREKAGVFAVRQGPPLAANLRRALWGEACKPFRPQKRFLSLVSTGDRYAVASKSVWSVEGAWVWKCKDWIDRRFMAKYQELPAMRLPETAPPVAAPGDPEPPSKDIRCKGCASKIGATALLGALESIEPFWREDVSEGLQSRDDAAVIEVPPDKVLVQSVDFFPAVVDDPYLFGRIAANHALGDVYAMGAAPQSALAVAGLPFSASGKSEDLLRQMLLGANDMFRQARTNLAGGHTSECPELALGFVVNGLADRDSMLRKRGLREGDQLILTKALGTGMLFAAEMRLQAKGRWIEEAIESMLLSSSDAARILREHGAVACTDVTGFGLAGHLFEMLEASEEAAEIFLLALPTLDGTHECIDLGIFSSLHDDNLRVWRKASGNEDVEEHVAFPLLFDPQTAGGLLAGIPGDKADACLHALWRGGCPDAARIGRVVRRSHGNRVLRGVWSDGRGMT